MPISLKIGGSKITANKITAPPVDKITLDQRPDTIPKPKDIKGPTPIYYPHIVPEDVHDPDPKVGPKSEAFLAMAKPDAKTAREACLEMNAALNRLSYWLYYPDWFALALRTGIVWDDCAGKAWPPAKAGLKKFWAEYAETMKQPKHKWSRYGWITVLPTEA